MSKKHNAKHPERSRSRYAERLAARGYSKAPAMPTVESLRSKQGRKEWLEAHPAIVANLAAYRGEAA